MRKIPATMATQHPDNASPPYWGQTPFISTLDELEECYRTFSDLGCEEYMWDWEGKFVDEAVVDRLFNRYPEFFQKHQLGRDNFLTFRVPNPSQESGFRLARSYMSLITAAHTAVEHKVHTPPVFEMILPMTTEASQLLALQKKYLSALKFEEEIFGRKIARASELELIPLIEGSATLLNSEEILHEYVEGYEKLFSKRPAYLRPFVARSDPALDAGFIPAVLSARGAISEYYRFQEETGIRVYPIIGVGCPLFRGGLSPTTLDEFFENYGGVRTLTVQSAFRYDYPRVQVQKALKRINREIPRLKPTRFSKAEIQEMIGLAEHFAAHYRSAIVKLAGEINDIARFIPSHRERIQHTGHFGYSRKIGGKTKLPRAITFVASVASLGIPPSIMGTGRALKNLSSSEKKNFLKKLPKYLPTFRSDLEKMGPFLNKENLKFLKRLNPAWEEVAEDARLIEEFLGKSLGPTKPSEYIHRNLTSNIFHLWRQGNKLVAEEILRAARVRRSLG